MIVLNPHEMWKCNVVLQKTYSGTLVILGAGISRLTIIITKEANEYIIHVLAVTGRINE